MYITSKFLGFVSSASSFVQQHPIVSTGAVAVTLAAGSYIFQNATVANAKKAINYAFNHPLKTAAGVAAAAAALYYAPNVVSSCLSKAVVSCVEQAPVCTTGPANTLLGSESLGNLVYGAAETSCFTPPPVCTTAEPSTCAAVVERLFG